MDTGKATLGAAAALALAAVSAHLQSCNRDSNAGTRQAYPLCSSSCMHECGCCAAGRCSGMSVWPQVHQG